MSAGPWLGRHRTLEGPLLPSAAAAPLEAVLGTRRLAQAHPGFLVQTDTKMQETGRNEHKDFFPTFEARQMDRYSSNANALIFSLEIEEVIFLRLLRD